MSEPGPNEPVEAAINRVLEAEKEARQAIESCRLDARHIVNRARQEATRSLERADGRIGLMHRRCEQSVGRRLAELRAEAERIPDEAVLEPDMRERLEAIVQGLAQEMTTGVTK